MDKYFELACVRRSGVIESRHFGSLVALDADGRVALALGDPDAVVLPRSTVKPAQALATLTAGAALEGPQLAIAAGSHTGQDEHVRVVREILGRAGLDDAALGCPPDWPEDPGTREQMVRASQPPTSIRMNCSGKHAAMLLACAVNGWSTTDYLDARHPLQQHVRAELARLTGVGVQADAVDGCGAPLFGTSTQALAALFRALVLAEEGTPERAVADTMRRFPFYVGGTGQQNTVAMESVPGLLAKGGAEGVIGMAAPTGQAVAMKVIDGSPRATTLVALHVLAGLGVEVSAASSLLEIPVLGGGKRVGQMEISEVLADALTGLNA